VSDLPPETPNVTIRNFFIAVGERGRAHPCDRNSASLTVARRVPCILSHCALGQFLVENSWRGWLPLLEGGSSGSRLPVHLRGGGKVAEIRGHQHHGALHGTLDGRASCSFLPKPSSHCKTQCGVEQHAPWSACALPAAAHVGWLAAVMSPASSEPADTAEEEDSGGASTAESCPCHVGWLAAVMSPASSEPADTVEEEDSGGASTCHVGWLSSECVADPPATGSGGVGGPRSGGGGANGCNTIQYGCQLGFSEP
jgi:hypothetical protein